MDVKIDGLSSNELRSLIEKRKLELEEAPEFLQRLTSFIEVEVGKSATFVGQFKANPETAVKWYKDEEQLVEDSRHVFEFVYNTGLVKLTILHLNRKDEGAYKCRVENEKGVATTTGYLSVIASKSRGRRSSKRKGCTERVSSPPLLNSIVEQRSVEEIEENEYKTMPPSPLHEFLSSIRHSSKSMNAPIVYGDLENFNDILDVEGLTDDEEVFEMNKKGQRSSDEDELSTGESSSSEAECAKTPTDQSLPQMLGLARVCDQQISKFTPVRVLRASKENLPLKTPDSSGNFLDGTARAPAIRPKTLTRQVKISTAAHFNKSENSLAAVPNETSNHDLPQVYSISTHRPIISSFYPSSSTSSSPTSLSSSSHPQSKNENISKPVQHLFSSEVRPLRLSPVHTYLSNTNVREICHVNETKEMFITKNIWFVVCTIVLSTFVSASLSMSPRDLVLIVIAVTSIFLFLRMPLQ